MINDPYIGMPIIIDGNWQKPGWDCGCSGCNGCTDGAGGCCNGDAGDSSSGNMDNSGSTGDGSFDSMYLGSLPLAMAYVPFQRWKTTYSLDRALQAGTIFPELDLPFRGGMRR